MNYSVKVGDPSKLNFDVIIYFCRENKLKEISGINLQLSINISESAKQEKFLGKKSEFLLINSGGAAKAYKILITGLGKADEFSFYELYKAVAQSIKKAQTVKPAKIALYADDFFLKKFTAEKTVRIIGEAAYLTTYKYNKYKSKNDDREKEIEEVTVILPAAKIREAETGLKLAKVIGAAVNFARDLINETPENTSPSYLASQALSIAKESKDKVTARIFEEEEVKKLGMGAFLGVAAGSDKESKFIRLSYKPVRPTKKVVIIGKGITFDSGGLSLKSADHMETMKFDMSGAAAVISVFKALPEIQTGAEVVGLIAACENMPSGKALKPGDILKAMNGKTIEVLNTDAEGRLTLADALSYAVIKEKADEIIDLATLTGACIVALGQSIAGLFGNNKDLQNKILNSSISGGEKVWLMPLEEEYRELIKSHIADLKNIQTGRWGGAITASLFLSEFVGETAWVHLDIAGPAFEEKGTALIPHGGAGFGVRTILEYLQSI